MKGKGVMSPFGLPTAAVLVVGLGLAAGGLVPQEVVEKIPSDTLSEWVGPPGVLLLLYETVRRGLTTVRSLREEFTKLQKRQARIIRELGIRFDDEP